MSDYRHVNCEEAADVLISGKSAENASPELIAHVVTCIECQSILNAVSDIRTHSSAFEGESYPELKSKIMQKLVLKDIEESEQEQKTIVLERNPQSIFAQWFKYAFAFAIVIAIFIYTLTLNLNTVPIDVIEKTIQTAKNINSEKCSFRILINGCVERCVNEDSANVTIYKDETADVEYIDGTACHLSGPAKVDLQQRGFSLDSGELFIEVAKNEAMPFVGQTPHGLIKVLGTSFKVSVGEKFTELCVVKGKVQVTDLQKKVKELNAGQSILLRQ